MRTMPFMPKKKKSVESVEASEPPPKKDTRPPGPRLSPGLHAAMVALAARDETNIHVLGRIAVREYLERRGFWPPPAPPDGCSQSEK